MAAAGMSMLSQPSCSYSSRLVPPDCRTLQLRLRFLQPSRSRQRQWCSRPSESLGFAPARCCNANGSSDNASSSSSSSSSSSGEGSHSGDGGTMWDMQSLHAAASPIGDSVQDFFSGASRTLQTTFDSHNPENGMPVGIGVPMLKMEMEWDWDRWCKHFIEVEEKEKAASILKSELETAVHEEDFKAATRLKAALKEATIDDPAAEVLAELMKAIKSESYKEAKRLRDEAAAGMIGWWVGLAEGENDPYGKIINISPSFGRFIAKAYTARQLADSASGVPLFEIYLRKDSNGYHQQVVYLHQGTPRESASSSANGLNDNKSDVAEMDIQTRNEKEINVKDLTEDFSDSETKSGDTAVTDEGLNNIIDYLKDRIPDVKLKVFNVMSKDGEDIPNIVDKILEEVEAQDNVDGAESIPDIVDKLFEEFEAQENESAKSKKNSSEDVQEENQENPGSDEESVEQMREMPIRLLVGGVPQNRAEDRQSKSKIRIPAKIEFQSLDSFLMHIEDASGVQSTESLPSLKVATIMAKSSSDLPSGIGKVASSFDKIPVKVSKEMSELLKLAISQVQKRNGLSKCTSFKRIKFPDSDKDPLTGLYIGSFGPFTSELVQLRRKHGHWHDESDLSKVKDKLEFFEYVEAVKLTGDLNVPAGQVTFRAKVGKDNRSTHRGIYPKELGVIARYKGQGMLAEPGFKNPQWVDGELLLFDGKGFAHLNGAELGFVYSVPERHFLVLFNRVKL